MNRVVTLALVLAIPAGLTGCDDPNAAANSGSGNGIPTVTDAPKSILGKAVKSAKDTRETISSGGNSREAAVLNAKIKLEQLGETINAMKGRGLSATATELVAQAEKVHERAMGIVSKAEESTAHDDGTEVKKIRDVVAEVESAINKAKQSLGH